MANENLMNRQHKAHTQASRDGHEATFGKKCHWHGCRDAVTKKAGVWLCEACCQECARERDRIIERAKAQPESDCICQECLDPSAKKVS